LLLPLFSAPSRRSWGIGEIGDLPLLSQWLRRAGLDFVQMLPLNEMASGQHSPYAAVTAMAIDPIYISVWAVEDFQALGGEPALGEDDRRRLAEVRVASRIAYNDVRALKFACLRAAYERFVEQEWKPDTSRAAGLRAYLARDGWWVDDYALFRVLREEHEERAWWTWEGGLATRDPDALSRARARLWHEWLFFAYMQWIADTQWHEARAASAPVGVFGDLPFMVGSDSADVWTHQHAFNRDASVGAPPDAFSETGQDWGLPAYRWDVFAAEDDAWIRARAARNAALFDGYRIDHLVGFYRTYVIPHGGGKPTFSPAEEPAQLTQGERVMRAFQQSGAAVIAEDLGTVPEFVRESLARLGMPGFKVFRWERAWKALGMPFRDPLAYPAVSVATTGTHDTETLVEWWETADEEERRLVAAIPFLHGRPITLVGGIDGATRDSLLELLVASHSNIVILPIQDIFGWPDRINIPATVRDHNWTWRLPWPLDALDDQPEACERADTVRHWIQRHGRSEVLRQERQDFRAHV
jgi:4-alpha-glucanotransferase